MFITILTIRATNTLNKFTFEKPLMVSDEDPRPKKAWIIIPVAKILNANPLSNSLPNNINI